MTDDELLNWLDSLPESWTSPEDLSRPTNSILVNYVVLVLTSRFTSNAINEAVGHLLVEKERFSIWFAVEAKERLDERQLLELSDATGRLLEPCWSGWIRFTELFDSGGPSGQDYQELLDTLRRSTAGFAKLRQK